ncbi:MAG: preprotein translocase subunit SecE [Massiliimalia sp.]|jgi:preprotein translocase subunit SecE
MAKGAAKTAAGKPSKDKKPSLAKRFTRYFKDLKSEIKKVVWPTKKQVKNHTLVVLAFMAMTAAFIWIVDFVVGSLIRLVLG